MKKLLLISVLAVAFAGCGGSVTSASTAGSATTPGDSGQPTPTTPPPTPPPPIAGLPDWVNALAIGQWYQIPNTALSSVEPSPIPLGITGPQSKVIAWTSFVVDTRTSMVYSVANGGHGDYGGNEVDRLDLQTNSPQWINRLPPTPNNQILEEVTHYSDGRPTSRHTYYGVTFNEFDDRIMLVGGSRYGGPGTVLPTTDSYNIGANGYSPAGTHPNVMPATVVSINDFTTVSNPLTGDVYSFSSFASAKWTRATNTWTATGASGPSPWGIASMSAMDTTRGRILILGGLNSDRHIYTISTNSFTQITLTGASAATVSGAIGGAMAYVPALDRFLIRLDGAGGTVFQVHPVTFAVTTFTTFGGGSVPATMNGPYNKFLYVPRLGGCVYVPTYSGNAWFLRIHP